MRKGSIALSFLLLASVGFAQGAQAGMVLRWEMKPYSQSAHIIRDHVVYSVRVGSSILQIARRSKDVELATGQAIQCRIEKGRVFVMNAKGKETQYEILGSEPTADTPAVK